MGSEEDLRKLGFQTRLKIFQETEKPDLQQNKENLANWRAILEGLDGDTGMHAKLSTIQLLSTYSMAIKLKSMQPQNMAYSELMSAL